MSTPFRIVFFGTPAFAVPSLSEIVGHGHEIAAVICEPVNYNSGCILPKPGFLNLMREAGKITLVTVNLLVNFLNSGKKFQLLLQLRILRGGIYAEKVLVPRHTTRRSPRCPAFPVLHETAVP